MTSPKGILAGHVHFVSSLAPTQAERQAVEEFRIEFEAFHRRTPPDCHCDVKMLVSYGHEKHCGYMAWKAERSNDESRV